MINQRTILSLLTIYPLLTSAQSDSFDDGNDLGWTQVDPIAQTGAGQIASFSFPDGAYQITTKKSPNDELLGPSRAGSLRLDQIYTDKLILTVDLKIPDPELRQAVGIFAMVQPEVGLGMTDGYSVNWQPAENDLIINRIDDEVPTRLVLGDLFQTADFEAGQRLAVSIGSGTIKASLYNLTDLRNPIAQIEATDNGEEAYRSGTAGLFLFSDANNPTGTTKAIFDNYQATDGTPPTPTITRTDSRSLQVALPTWTLPFHHLQSTQTLAKEPRWTNIPPTHLAITSETATFTQELSEERTQFFRIVPKP